MRQHSGAFAQKSYRQVTRPTFPSKAKSGRGQSTFKCVNRAIWMQSTNRLTGEKGLVIPPYCTAEKRAVHKSQTRKTLTMQKEFKNTTQHTYTIPKACPKNTVVGISCTGQAIVNACMVLNVCKAAKKPSKRNCSFHQLAM